MRPSRGFRIRAVKRSIFMKPQAGDAAVKGFQNTRSEKVYFYAVVNHPIKAIQELKKLGSGLFVLGFGAAQGPLEFRIGLSYVGTDNAKQNLEQELEIGRASCRERGQ